MSQQNLFSTGEQEREMEGRKESSDEYYDRLDQELEREEREQNPDPYPEGAVLMTYVLLFGLILIVVSFIILKIFKP